MHIKMGMIYTPGFQKDGYDVRKATKTQGICKKGYRGLEKGGWNRKERRTGHETWEVGGSGRHSPQFSFIRPPQEQKSRGKLPRLRANLSAPLFVLATFLVNREEGRMVGGLLEQPQIRGHCPGTSFRNKGNKMTRAGWF